MKLKITPLTDPQIREMINWRYENEYAIYNMDDEDQEKAVKFYNDPSNGYFAVLKDDGEFIGTCNYGFDAQVPGGDYTAEGIDIGIAIRPDLTGQGNGSIFSQAVFEFANKHYPGLPHRVTIAAFNRRSQRVCEKIGFQVTGMFVRERDGMVFVQMMRPFSA